MTEHFTLVGVRISTELGTDEAPQLIRLSQFTEGPFQQSYALMADGGSVLVDPVRPKPREGEQPFLDRIGDCQAIVLTTAMHERNVYWFRERLGAPIFCPAQSVGEMDGSIDHGFGDGDELPGGMTAFWTGDETQGDAILRWTAPDGQRVLLAGDAVNGQTRPGMFNGAVEPYWMKAGAIRLRLPGVVPQSEFEARFGRFRDIEADLILNGHNPRPVEDAQASLASVLDHGEYEVHESRTCSYLWTDLPPI